MKELRKAGIYDFEWFSKNQKVYGTNKKGDWGWISHYKHGYRSVGIYLPIKNKRIGFSFGVGQIVWRLK